MKKILLLIVLSSFLSGCSTIKEESITDIVKNGMNSTFSIANVIRSGYKYYLPKGIKNIDSQDYNEVLYNDRYAFYLYVDVVSYFNKVSMIYQPNEKYYYSTMLKNNDKFGYLQVKRLQNDNYFVEIMYNYAKIEVIVTEKDIKESVAYAIAIIDSVTYNDTVLGSLMGDNVLNANELEYNIFETATSESNYLEMVEQYDQYKNQDEVPDTDFIK